MKKLLSILILWPVITYAQQVQWPHHHKAAIVLTYDDALPSQLNHAAPQLVKAGLKATFFLTSDIDSASILRWRKLAKQGFELVIIPFFIPAPEQKTTRYHPSRILLTG